MKLVISIQKKSLMFDVNEDTAQYRIDPLNTEQRKERASDFCRSLVDHLSVNEAFSLNNFDEDEGEFSLGFKGGNLRLYWLSYNPLYGIIELTNPTEEFKEWCVESIKHFGAQYSSLYDVTEDVLV